MNYQEQINELRKLIKSDPNGNKDLNNLNEYSSTLNLLRGIRIIPPLLFPLDTIKGNLEYLEAKKQRDGFNLEQIAFCQNFIGRITDNLQKFPLQTDLEISLGQSRKELIEINDQLNNLNNSLQVNTLRSNLDGLNHQKTEGNQKLSEIKFSRESLQKLSEQIEQLTIRIVPGLLLQQTEYKNQIIQLKEKYDNGQYYLQVYERQVQLQIKANQIIRDNQSLKSLYDLKQRAFDLECDRLQIIVDSLNESLNSILQSIFERPIKVLIQLYKKNKTNDKIKSKVNLYIQYDGNEYDSINKLSGGEKDRISFALTLAKSILNDSPFLLLDETLRSLNESYRTCCLEVMRNFLSDKTILCINHEDTEGNYDSIISLNSSF